MKKKYYLKYIILLLVILYNFSNILIYNKIFLASLTIFLFFKTKLWKRKVFVDFLKILFVYLAFVCIISIIYQELPELTLFLTYPLYFILAISLNFYFKKEIFIIYEKILFKLTIVSLIFFSIQLLFFNPFYSLILYISSFLPNPEFANGTRRYANILFYTINYSGTIQRNTGFEFEPGLFAIHLCFAILLNVLNNKNLFSKRNLVYLIALFTTFSTTGMIGLLLIVVFYFLNKTKGVKKFVFSPIVMITIVIIASLPFVTDKIYGLLVSSKGLYAATNYWSVYNQSISLGRFAGLLYVFDILKEANILFGLFSHSTNLTRENLVVVNGLAILMKHFGVLGLLLILTMLFLSLKKLVNEEYKHKYFYFIFVMFVGFLFSYPFSYEIIFWIILFYLFNSILDYTKLYNG